MITFDPPYSYSSKNVGTELNMLYCNSMQYPKETVLQKIVTLETHCSDSLEHLQELIFGSKLTGVGVYDNDNNLVGLSVANMLYRSKGQRYKP